MGRRAIIGVPYKLTSRGVSVTIVDKDKNGRLNGKVDHVLVHGSKVDPKVAQTKLRKLGIDLRKSNGATLKLFSGYVKEIKGALEYASKGNVVMARYCFSNAFSIAKKAGIRPIKLQGFKKLYARAINLAVRYALKRNSCKLYLRCAKFFAKHAGIKYSDKPVKQIYMGRYKEAMKVAFDFAHGKNLQKDSLLYRGLYIPAYL